MGSLEELQSGGSIRQDTPLVERHWQHMQLLVVAPQLKPLLLFPAQILCAVLLVLFPVALHLLYIKATGDEYATPLVSDLNFLGDWFDLCRMVRRGDAEDVSLRGHLFRVMGISVHFLGNSLLWPLCTHVAASCLLDANPPLIQSLKAALRASRHVLAMSLPPFLYALWPIMGALIGRYLTGEKSPPIPPDSQDPTIVVMIIMTYVILSVLFAVFINSVFGFAPVMASLHPDTQDPVLETAGTRPRTWHQFWRAAVQHWSSTLYSDKVGRMLVTGYKYGGGWRFILFLLHLQFYVPHLAYLKFWVDVKERNAVSVAKAIMSITAMALLKVYIVVYICALCLHKRAAHVEAGADSEPSKDLAAAKIWTPFDADNKSTILGVVAALDGALAVDGLCSYPPTSYKTFPV